jgi:molecular chaperone GrpE
MEEIREDSIKENTKTEKSIEENEITSEQEMAKMQQELEQANDTMLRLAAELDNYKKRVAKERESLIKYAVQDVIQELIPILDNFERAIDSASKTKDMDSFLEGVKMIFNQMNDTLSKKGVKKIGAVGKPFDPNFHEAVMQVDSDEYPENVVVEELQKGYMLNDRVVRPAMVVVSKGASREEK